MVIWILILHVPYKWFNTVKNKTNTEERHTQRQQEARWERRLFVAMNHGLSNYKMVKINGGERLVACGGEGKGRRHHWCRGTIGNGRRREWCVEG